VEWSRRIITRLPAEELWTDTGPVESARERNLSAADLRQLLAAGPVRFVYLNVGDRPDWVPLQHCFVFWKHEIQPHLAEPNARASLEEFPASTVTSPQSGPRWTTCRSWCWRKPT